MGQNEQNGVTLRDMRRGGLILVGALLCSGLLAACTALLGDDFAVGSFDADASSAGDAQLVDRESPTDTAVPPDALGLIDAGGAVPVSCRWDVPTELRVNEAWLSHKCARAQQAAIYAVDATHFRVVVFGLGGVTDVQTETDAGDGGVVQTFPSGIADQYIEGATRVDGGIVLLFNRDGDPAEGRAYSRLRINDLENAVSTSPIEMHRDLAPNLGRTILAVVDESAGEYVLAIGYGTPYVDESGVAGQKPLGVALEHFHADAATTHLYSDDDASTRRFAGPDRNSIVASSSGVFLLGLSGTEMPAPSEFWNVTFPSNDAQRVRLENDLSSHVSFTAAVRPTTNNRARYIVGEVSEEGSVMHVDYLRADLNIGSMTTESAVRGAFKRARVMSVPSNPGDSFLQRAASAIPYVAGEIAVAEESDSVGENPLSALIGVVPFSPQFANVTLMDRDWRVAETVKVDFSKLVSDWPKADPDASTPPDASPPPSPSTTFSLAAIPGRAGSFRYVVTATTFHESCGDGTRETTPRYFTGSFTCTPNSDAGTK